VAGLLSVEPMPENRGSNNASVDNTPSRSAPDVCIRKLSDSGTSSIEAALLHPIHRILQKLNLKGNEKILIKPNLVNSSPAKSGVTTDPRILNSLIKILQSEGFDDICIGESSIENTNEVFQALGVARLETQGAKVINFDAEQDGWVVVDSPLGLALKRFRVARAARDCDLIISVAKMKTHCDAGVTLSMKNLLGTISPADRQAAHRTDINRAIADVYSYFHANKKVISIVDALYALEGRRGPITGNPVKMNLLLCGSDPLATDAACVEIMGGSAAAIPHLALAREHNLGILDFIADGVRIEDVRRDFEMPPLLPTVRLQFTSLARRHLFKKRPFLRYAEKCTGCGSCVQSCPVRTMAVRDRKAWIPDDKCIGCLVCVETCRQGALDYKMRNAHVFQVARGLYRLIN
jgi:uncharacterized protein (DUF362 family)